MKNCGRGQAGQSPGFQVYPALLRSRPRCIGGSIVHEHTAGCYGRYNTHVVAGKHELADSDARYQNHNLTNNRGTTYLHEYYSVACMGKISHKTLPSNEAKMDAVSVRDPANGASRVS